LFFGLLVAHFLPAMLPYLQFGVLLYVSITIIDFLLLYALQNGLYAERKHAPRLSNGDSNEITIVIQNRYRYPIFVSIEDELPFQFQNRNHSIRGKVLQGTNTDFHYSLTPKSRGEYFFGILRVFASTQLGLVERRFSFGEPNMVPVYPSYLQMRRYELMAVGNRLTELGVKRVRRIGQTMEFDTIRPYTEGDDKRNVNWKATARRSAVMVNQYQDEKSRPVYVLIDTGRTMKAPFNQMTLVDYSVNAALVLLNTALIKDDRAGLITFGHEMGNFIPAEKNRGHIRLLLEALYSLSPQFLESDIRMLYTHLRKRPGQRSTLFMFTNFDSLWALKRHLPYLRLIAKRHLLVIIFFQNTELEKVLSQSANTTEEVYIKTIAEKFDHEKRQMLTELRAVGIQVVLTTPEQLTVQALNKFLEIKARQMM
jgi:uncharacterized protein (DUF58 family)